MLSCFTRNEYSFIVSIPVVIVIVIIITIVVLMSIIKNYQQLRAEHWVMYMLVLAI